jgi:hypothetical protein
MFLVPKWVMWAHFIFLRLKSFPMVYKTLQSNEFWPLQSPSKNLESIGIPTPKMGAHLGIWGFILSHSPIFSRTWNVTPGLHSWPTALQALVLITSPKLGLRYIFVLMIFTTILQLVYDYFGVHPSVWTTFSLFFIQKITIYVSLIANVINLIATLWVYKGVFCEF